jgi:hypothetical protein
MMEASQNLEIDSGYYQTVGVNEVQWTFTASADSFGRLAVDELSSSAVAVFGGVKIKSLTVTVPKKTAVELRANTG